MKSEADAPTINDVARIAGVSKRTVSRVINNSPKVNEKTRKDVLGVIKKLKYVPNPQARGLASSKSYLLGLLYDDPNALFIHAVQRGVLSVCTPAGYELIVHPCDHLSRTLVSGVRKFVTRSKIDGLIILPPLSANSRLASALAGDGIHYVRMAARELDQPERMVVSPDREVMHEMADHLVELGHRNIGFITGPRHRLASEERLRGFRDALASHGVRLDDENVLEGDFTYASGVQCGIQLLKRSRPPTAIFASNDDMAAGVIRAAWERGIRVPEGLSVAGYDDSPLASMVVPPLTTFRRRNEEMAAHATRKLLGMIGGQVEMAAAADSCFTPELVIRQSTGPCPL